MQDYDGLDFILGRFERIFERMRGEFADRPEETRGFKAATKRRMAALSAEDRKGRGFRGAYIEGLL